MKTTMIAVTAATMLLATGCSVVKKTAVPVKENDRLVESTTPDEVKTDMAATLSNSWELQEAGGYKIVGDDEDNLPSITFNLNDKGCGEVYCFTGCNYINGDVDFNFASSTVTPHGNYMSTMKACSPEAETAERHVSQALASMKGFKLEHLDASWVLRLTGADGNTLLTARRWDNHFLNGAWEVTAIGDTSVASSADLQLVIDIPEMSIHGNTGCNIVNGTIRLLPDRINGIEFGQLASTRRACAPETETLERNMLIALENTASCRSAEDGEEAMLIDESGNVVLRLHRLILKR